MSCFSNLTERGNEMSFEYILFDLDGTLIDPQVGITKSVEYALCKMGVKIIDRAQLDLFIGPPLQETFHTLYEFNEKEVEEAIVHYRERFKEKGLYENTVYPGIESLLSALKREGKVIAVATSKPTVFAEKILQHFELAHYFDVIVGSNLDGTRTAKNEVIHEVLVRLSFPERRGIVMIGDRKHDIIGAQKESISSIGVLFGYGSKEEIELAKPTFIVSEVDELGCYLLNE